MQVTDHARQLMEKHLGKPFFDGGYAGSVARMTADDLQEGLAWVDDRFFPIRYEDEALPSVEWVLNVAKAAVLRYCFHCTVLYKQTSYFMLVGMPMLAHFTVLRCSQPSSHQLLVYIRLQCSEGCCALAKGFSEKARKMLALQALLCCS